MSRLSKRGFSGRRFCLTEAAVGSIWEIDTDEVRPAGSPRRDFLCAQAQRPVIASLHRTTGLVRICP
jgi:hypothetical protein